MSIQCRDYFTGYNVQVDGNRNRFYGIAKCDTFQTTPRWFNALRFTGHGVLHLANVLTVERATQMSIRIIEVFVQMREALIDNLSLKLDIEEIKKKLTSHSKNIELVFNYLDELIEKKDNEKPRKQIGYKPDTE